MCPEDRGRPKVTDFAGSRGAWMQCVPYEPVKRFAAEVPAKACGSGSADSVFVI